MGGLLDKWGGFTLPNKRNPLYSRRKIITYQELAGYLGVSRWSILRWQKKTPLDLYDIFSVLDFVLKHQKKT